MKALVQELCQGDFLEGIFVAAGGREKNGEEERNNDELSHNSSHFLLVSSLSLFRWFCLQNIICSTIHRSYLPTHKLKLTGFSTVIFTYATSLYNALKLRNKKYKQMLELFWREKFTNNSHLVPSKFSSR